MTPYVMHVCKNKRCQRGFLDKDTTGATSRPPQWKYCDLCELAGFVSAKDPEKVERGRRLAELARRRKLEKEEALEGI